MELIRTIKEKVQTKKQEEIHQEAEEIITLSDFGDNLYIAYAGVPLLLIKEEWTTKEIVQELTKIRQNYINSKIKDYGCCRRC